MILNQIPNLELGYNYYSRVHDSVCSTTGRQRSVLVSELVLVAKQPLDSSPAATIVDEHGNLMSLTYIDKRPNYYRTIYRASMPNFKVPYGTKVK